MMYVPYNGTRGSDIRYFDYPIHSFHSYEPPSEDERTNPKFWARWFREFLFEIYGYVLDALILYIPIGGLGMSTNSSQSRRPRDNPLLLREWKFKNWCQGL